MMQSEVRERAMVQKKLASIRRTREANDRKFTIGREIQPFDDPVLDLPGIKEGSAGNER